MVGTDISAPRFPSNPPPPPPAGVTFPIQDILNPWPEAWRNSSDFVQQRLMLAGGGSKASDAVKGLLENVTPRGWVQLIESAPNVDADDRSAMHQFLALLQEMFTFMGTRTTL